jgi:zinc protease
MTTKTDRTATTISSAKRAVLSNGIVALVQANPGSQTVSVAGEILVGSVNEPVERGGLAMFTGAALIRGTAQRSFQQIVAETEERGASVNAGGGVHSGRFGGRALPEDLPLVLGTLAEMLATPSFPEIEIERLRGQFLMSLRESEQDTGTLVSRAARELLYPDGHPYRRLSTGTLASVGSISRADLVAFHQLYHPRNTVIAVVGAVDPAAVIEVLEQTFGQWQVARTPLTHTPLPTPVLEGINRRTVNVAGKSQTDVAWAVHGLERAHPDYYVASVANMILGRIGLGGRLGANVREEQGLAYYVGSSLDADLAAGPWSAMAGVNPADVERALDAMLHEIALFTSAGPTAQELSDAQDFMTGSLVLGLETNDGIAGTLLGIERYNLGFDYISRYAEIIRAITVEQVTDVARRYLSSSNYIVAVAGP